MMTDKGIDTGDILLQRETDILPEENAGQLLNRLSEIGASLLIETLEKIEAGSCPRTPQDASKASYFPMLKKETGLIDFSKNPERIVNLVRGLNPWPGAYALLPEGALKVHKARPVALEHAAKPGEIVEASAKKGLVVMCRRRGGNFRDAGPERQANDREGVPCGQGAAGGPCNE
jgi:methionyl-tRNA formyltransferase